MSREKNDVFEIIFESLNVEERIQNSDLIITGEGQFDISSTYNKAPRLNSSN